MFHGTIYHSKTVTVAIQIDKAMTRQWFPYNEISFCNNYVIAELRSMVSGMHVFHFQSDC